MSSPSQQSSDGGPPPVNFAQFLVSLGSSAMVHLGETAAPDGRVHRDLPLASHTLGVLELLQEKTKGNLDADESRLLSALIDEIGSKMQPA